jgi:hypothetical protein
LQSCQLSVCLEAALIFTLAVAPVAGYSLYRSGIFDQAGTIIRRLGDDADWLGRQIGSGQFDWRRLRTANDAPVPGRGVASSSDDWFDNHVIAFSSGSSGGGSGRPIWNTSNVWHLGPTDIRQSLLKQGVPVETVDEIIEAVNYWVNEDWTNIVRAMAGEVGPDIPASAVRYAQVLSDNLHLLPEYRGPVIRGINVHGDTADEILGNVFNIGSGRPGDRFEEGRLISFFAQNDSLPYRSADGYYRYDDIIAEANVIYIMPEQSSAVVIGNPAQGEVLIPPNVEFTIVRRDILTRNDRTLRNPSDPLYLDPSDSNFQFTPEVTVIFTLEEIP